MSAMKLSVDPSRAHLPESGILVWAELDGKFGAHDIAHLSAPSLIEWLRSRGGENEWAENTVGHLLGHDVTITDGIDCKPTP